MKPTQSRRPIAIQTGLGADALLLTRFNLREQISRPFEIEADLAAIDPKADFNKVVGHQATIRMELGGKGTRYFNGYVSRLVQLGNQGQFARYRATIVPWLWFLTRTSDCRVFQRMSVLDIAEEVFGKHRFGSEFYDLQTSGRYSKRRYCVQYRETDFNFVNRLLESEGIYYWFSHARNRHRLVLGDRIGASKPAPGFESLDYHEVEQGPVTGREVVTDWTVEKEVQPVNYDLKDFDFKKPSHPLKGKHEIPQEHGMARFAQYDYPGEYFEPGEANHYAQVRLEELQSRHEIVRGTTTAMGLCAGGVFELKAHPQVSQNRKYLITELRLTADAGEFASSGSGEPFFTSSLEAIPAEIPFRPGRVTPKPVIQGVQTATVVGPPGEEIHTDEHARVKVQFHWDRYGKKDAESSCFVRVSQPWAGKGWGSQATPRIGQEVIVEFIEGDPDRPIIIGRVYNGENKPPYGKAGVVSGLKSQTHKGAGFNEMSMDDTAGAEEIKIHGQYDMNTVVEHDQTTTVHNNRTDKIDVDDSETVGNNQSLHVVSNRTKNVDVDQTVTIGANQTETVGGNETLSVGGHRTRNVAKNESINVGLMRSHTVGVNESITVGIAQEVTVGGYQSVTVGAMQTVSVGMDQSNTIGGAQTNDVSKDRTTSVGKNDSLKVAKKLTIDAGDEILIKTGGASIHMKKNGDIVIKGKNIKVKGTKIEEN